MNNLLQLSETQVLSALAGSVLSFILVCAALPFWG